MINVAWDCGCPHGRSNTGHPGISRQKDGYFLVNLPGRVHATGARFNSRFRDLNRAIAWFHSGDFQHDLFSFLGTITVPPPPKRLGPRKQRTFVMQNGAYLEAAGRDYLERIGCTDIVDRASEKVGRDFDMTSPAGNRWMVDVKPYGKLSVTAGEWKQIQEYPFYMIIFIRRDGSCAGTLSNPRLREMTIRWTSGVLE